MHILQGHRRAVRALAYAPGDPATLASAGDGGSVRLWNLSTAQNGASLGGHVSGLLSLAFAPNGNLLATGGRDGSLRLWDVAHQRPHAVLPWREPIYAVAFASGGRTVLA